MQMHATVFQHPRRTEEEGLSALRVAYNTRLAFSRLALTMKLAFLILFSLVAACCHASDPSQLQDFCVADPHSPIVMNGKVCKNPSMAKPEDFFFRGLDKPGNATNPLGSMVTAVNVQRIPGLNTLGISLARIDFAPWGVNPPHIHPRGTEILVVLEGCLYVGFVTSNPHNRLFSKKLYKGDVFVFPQGLIHFQQNVGEEEAVALAGLSSQNPGVITITNSGVGAKPPISVDLLVKALQLDKKVIEELQSAFWMDNNN